MDLKLLCASIILLDKRVKISIKYKGRDQSLKMNGWRPLSDNVTFHNCIKLDFFEKGSNGG